MSDLADQTRPAKGRGDEFDAIRAISEAFLLKRTAKQRIFTKLVSKSLSEAEAKCNHLLSAWR